jgi:predicted Fe-Mo cluster-binding NifX family protein
MLIAHFGHCQELALIDVEENEIKNNKIIKSPLHEPGILPKWQNELGINVLISGGMGHRAINPLNQRGITVVAGALVEEPEILVKSYLSYTLGSEQNLCSGGRADSCGHIS